MATTAAEDSFLLHCWNRRAIKACMIGVDDPGLWMGWIAESLSKQPFGSRSISKRRQQEVDGGSRGIDGPIEVTPTALHPNVGFIDTPGFVGRLEMTAHPLLELRPVALNPSPHRGVVGLQAAFIE